MSETGIEQKYIQWAFYPKWWLPVVMNCGGISCAYCLRGKARGWGMRSEIHVLCFFALDYVFGATPVFIDSEKDTWNMNPDLLEYAI